MTFWLSSLLVAQAVQLEHTVRDGHVAMELASGHVPLERYATKVTIVQPLEYDARVGDEHGVDYELVKADALPLVMGMSFGIREDLVLGYRVTHFGGELVRTAPGRGMVTPRWLAMAALARWHPVDLWRLSPFLSAGIEYATIGYPTEAWNTHLPVPPSHTSVAMYRVFAGVGLEAQIIGALSVQGEFGVSKTVHASAHRNFEYTEDIQTTAGFGEAAPALEAVKLPKLPVAEVPPWAATLGLVVRL